MSLDEAHTPPRGIHVVAQPQYEEEPSNPQASLYVYSYKITIRNDGKQPVQLLNRRWLIRDGFNNVEQVVGEGVVGQKPVIEPGKAFSYSSFCPLKTPSGSMEGAYQMVNLATQEHFETEIPKFLLVNKMLMN